MDRAGGSQSAGRVRGARCAAVWIAWLVMAVHAPAGQPGTDESDRPSNGAGPVTTAAAHQNDPATTVQPGNADALRHDPRVRRLNQIVLWSVVLLLVFCVGAAAVVHFSRRYRMYLLRNRSEPTEDGDVWAMHQLPPERPGFNGDGGHSSGDDHGGDSGGDSGGGTDH